MHGIDFGPTAQVMMGKVEWAKLPVMTRYYIAHWMVYEGIIDISGLNQILADLTDSTKREFIPNLSK
jgi:hypothetical protein